MTEAADLGPGIGDGATPRRAPAAPLFLAAAVLATASALFALGDTLWVHLVGYVLATFILIGLVARHRWSVVRLRADRSYAHDPRVDRLGTALVVLGILVAAAHVWPMATELSR